MYILDMASEKLSLAISSIIPRTIRLLQAHLYKSEKMPLHSNSLTCKK